MSHRRAKEKMKKMGVDLEGLKTAPGVD